MNYQISDIQVHNIETALINAATQVQLLSNLIVMLSGAHSGKATTDICLEQLQNAQRHLDSLQAIPFIDLESDTQTA